MEENKCCDKCSKSDQYGAKMARAAFDMMENEAKQEDALSADAKAFIKECQEAGKNPIEVVKFLAGKEGIELSGKAPSDDGKRQVYDLLREVVDNVVEAAFASMDQDEDDDWDDPTIQVARNVPFRKTHVLRYCSFAL